MTDNQAGKPLNDEAPLDPAAMLALVQREQGEIARRLARQIPWILLTWGIVWLVGYGMLWLIDGAKPAFSVPLPVSVITFVVLMVAAIVVSAVIGSRAGRGIRSTRDAAFTGVVYGVTGSAGFFAIYAFAAGMQFNGMDPNLQSIFFPTGMGIVIGIMYLIAGAIWRTVTTVVMGGLLLLIAVVAPFFGYPNHYLFFALAGGGDFLGGPLSVCLFVRRTDG